MPLSSRTPGWASAGGLPPLLQCDVTLVSVLQSDSFPSPHFTLSWDPQNPAPCEGRADRPPLLEGGVWKALKLKAAGSVRLCKRPAPPEPALACLGVRPWTLPAATRVVPLPRRLPVPLAPSPGLHWNSGRKSSPAACTHMFIQPFVSLWTQEHVVPSLGSAPALLLFILLLKLFQVGRWEHCWVGFWDLFRCPRPLEVCLWLPLALFCLSSSA